jgi:hypothetical protein
LEGGYLCCDVSGIEEKIPQTEEGGAVALYLAITLAAGILENPLP